MPAAIGHYVEAQQVDFPHGKRLVAGPYETNAEAWDTMRALRSGMTGCSLSVRRVQAKQLPVVKRPAPTVYDLSRVEGRRAAANALADHVRALGCAVAVEDWDGEPDVDFGHNGLGANIWLGWTPAAPMPIVSWYAQPGRQLAALVPGAWSEPFPHRKATREPRGWADLFDMVTAGLCAAIDGSAFE